MLYVYIAQHCCVVCVLHTTTMCQCLLLHVTTNQVTCIFFRVIRSVSTTGQNIASCRVLALEHRSVCPWYLKYLPHFQHATPKRIQIQITIIDYKKRPNRIAQPRSPERHQHIDSFNDACVFRLTTGFPKSRLDQHATILALSNTRNANKIPFSVQSAKTCCSTQWTSWDHMVTSHKLGPVVTDDTIRTSSRGCPMDTCLYQPVLHRAILPIVHS